MSLAVQHAQPAVHRPASTVVATVMRVTADVITRVEPYALDCPEQQVSVRIGDALVFLRQYAVAERIRQRWDAAVYLASRRLPRQVPQRWLSAVPGTYPVTIAQQLTGAVEVSTSWHPGHPATHTPPHLRIQVGALIWQVCDWPAWRLIGEAWWSAAQHLQDSERN